MILPSKRSRTRVIKDTWLFTGTSISIQVHGEQEDCGRLEVEEGEKWKLLDECGVPFEGNENSGTR